MERDRQKYYRKTTTSPRENLYLSRQNFSTKRYSAESTVKTTKIHDHKNRVSTINSLLRKLPETSPVKESVLGLKVGDIEPPRTGTTVT